MEARTHDQSPAAPPQPATERVEPRSERLRRHSRRTGLYVRAFATAALVVVLVALVIANNSPVKVSWVVGSGRAALVWMIVLSAVLGWLLGIVTSVSFYRRTRRRRGRTAPPPPPDAAGA